jgi:hypothetical protein
MYHVYFPISYFSVGAGFPEHYDPYVVYCTSPIYILQVAKRTPERPFVLPESRGTLINLTSNL